MSMQFGRWNYDSAPCAPGYLEKASQLLAPYGPDGGDSYSGPGVDIVYRGFHTTKESRREKQPHAAPCGAVITWDGRLDNREELIRQLRGDLSIESTDVAIVAAAYEKWGTGCFGKLMGDWALAIWNPRNQSLILAKDFVGTRHLYYAIEKDQVTWSSILDPLVLLAGRAFTLEEEYIAGWFSFFPATHLTPYAAIHSVPPSSYVRIEQGRQTTTQYWDFDSDQNIRHTSDTEYEEHFRSVFAEAVRRRLRSDTPILAELSGGMDSSSIVCMADTIVACGAAETPRLDTVSYFDESEPNWNECPFFTRVEEKRGQAGCHIDVGSQEGFKFEFENERFAPTPHASRRLNKAAKQFSARLTSRGNRVVLSGIGGDEVMGGVPTPTPELANLMARAQLKTLAHQLKVWALNKRKPWFHLLFQAVRRFSPSALAGVEKDGRPPAWLRANFIRRYETVLTGYETRLRLFGPLPSYQENIATLNVLRRQLACTALPSAPTFEKRYPYLDRNLLEFIYTIPREQLVRPGQRRSLMRRALVGIVPNELLNRPRKAYVARSPMASISTEWDSLAEISRHMVSSSLGIVDANAFYETLRMAQDGREVPMVSLIRSFVLEAWLRNLSSSGIRFNARSQSYQTQRGTLFKRANKGNSIQPD